jgi:hypothetical protein
VKLHALLISALDGIDSLMFLPLYPKKYRTVYTERRSALPLRIREDYGSNLGQKISYPHLGFSWFSSVPLGKLGEYFKLGHDHFLPHPFQFFMHDAIRRYIV